MQRSEKIIVGILLLLIAFKLPVIMSFIINAKDSEGNRSLTDEQIKLFAVPLWLRIIVVMFGLRLIFGRAIGFVTIVLGVFLMVAFPVVGWIGGGIIALAGLLMFSMSDI